MAVPKKIDPAARYRIKVKKAVPVGRQILTPRMDGIIVKGRVLETIKADVTEAELIED